MYQPLYYLAGRNVQSLETKGRIDAQILREAGLGHLAEEATEIRFNFGEVVNNGPDGGAGALFSCEAQAKPEGERANPRMGFHPEEQIWEVANEDQGLWFGQWKEHPPQAVDLLRNSPFGGGLTLSILGRHFMIPVVRREDGTTQLPKDLKALPFREIVKPRYAEIWERTGPAFDWIAGGKSESNDFKLEPAFMLALDGLSLNYRVGAIEQNALALIDSGTWFEILCCMLDITSAEKLAAAKKKAQPSEPLEDANLSTGLTADSQDTSQVGATCG